MQGSRFFHNAVWSGASIDFSLEVFCESARFLHSFSLSPYSSPTLILLVKIKLISHLWGKNLQ